MLPLLMLSLLKVTALPTVSDGVHAAMLVAL